MRAAGGREEGMGVLDQCQGAVQQQGGHCLDKGASATLRVKKVKLDLNFA